MTKLLILHIFLFAIISLNAQNNNSVSRIDSLTHLFMENTLVKQQVFLTAEEVLNLTEQRFNALTSSIGTEIKFKFDPTVKTQIQYMTNPASSFLYKACMRKDVYFRVFEETLDRKGMPQEIKYLSIVESLLSPNAVSWCGATGLWQFMPATGRMMDLQIDGSVDERKDIYKSTEKACEYLQSMYNRFGDWLLALAAYNGGPGTVNKAITRSGGKRTFWEIKPYLPKETQNYIPKFLATAFLMTFAPPVDQIGNNLSAGEMLVPVRMCCHIDMKYISAVVNISEFEQMEWNSVYKDGIIPSHIENKTIALPYSKAMQVAQWQDSIYQVSANAFNPSDYIKNGNNSQTHYVKKGQTLPQIANMHKVNVSDVKRWNHLKGSKLKTGRGLKIYKSYEVILPLASPPLGFYFYITESNYQSMNDICSKFNEIDIFRSCEINNIISADMPLIKGKLIKLFLKPN